MADSVITYVGSTRGRLVEPVERACDGCEGSVLPGVHWPTATNADDSLQWVERCDECQRYVDDLTAAEVLVEHLRRAGATVEHGMAVAQGTSGPTPWVVAVNEDDSATPPTTPHERNRTR